MAEKLPFPTEGAPLTAQPTAAPPPPPPGYAWPYAPYPTYPYAGYAMPQVYRYGTVPPRFPITSRFRLAPCPPAVTLKPNTYVVTQRLGQASGPAIVGGIGALILMVTLLSSGIGLATMPMILGYSGAWVCAFLMAVAAATTTVSASRLVSVALGFTGIGAVAAYVTTGLGSTTAFGYVITAAAVTVAAAGAHAAMPRPHPQVGLEDDDESPWPRWHPERKGAYMSVFGGFILTVGAVYTGVVQGTSLPAYAAMLFIGVASMSIAGAVALAVPGDAVWMMRRVWSAAIGGIAIVAMAVISDGAPQYGYGSNGNLIFGSGASFGGGSLAGDYLFHTVSGVVMVIGLAWLFAGAAVQMFQPSSHLLVATPTPDVVPQGA